jgi:two-component system OmpR family response regulator
MPNRILIVDDDPVVRQFVDLVLTQHGYAISSAAASDTAMQILGRESFALVLLDICMPGMSGLDILRLMKSRQNKPKILMMTGERDPATIMQAIEQGAAGYLVKPFKPLDLLKRVEVALRGSSAASAPATAAAQNGDQLILD